MSHSFSGRSLTALLAVCLGAFMFGLEISAVPAALPGIEHALQTSFTDMQWIMNAYTIAVNTMLMAAGTLADRFGRRRLFVIGAALFGLTSLICGLAPQTGTLIAARALQGISGSTMLIATLAVISHQFESARERGIAFSVWGVVAGAGIGFGPMVGSLLVELTNWRWVFLVNVPFAIIAIGLALATVRESRDPHAGRLDLAGIVTLSLAVLGLAFYITQGPSLGFASATALAILAGAAVAFALFLFVETTVERPMVDFSVFRIRAFSGALFGCMGMNFAFWPFMIYLPLYFNYGLGYSAVTSGLALLAYTLPTLIFPPVGEWLALRYQAARVIPAGLAIIGFGFLIMFFGLNSNAVLLLCGAALAGAGLGIINTPVTNTTTGSVTRERAGMASSIDLSARMITLAINIAVMGFILTEGTLAALRDKLGGTLTGAPLRALAEQVAAGKLNGGALPAASLQAALIDGFAWVMLYGVFGAFAMASLSLLAFGTGPKTQSARAEA
ncbi:MULTISPECIES: MFS transporter [unclassified Beijerinckia]|uniref:MFS transporter n=1 Tax=unclassified Beijerinckia TaxID=2638183 RepID=UPI0008963AB4|nr:MULTISPECIES: MFS transporter [unclassified Beijerinckia]MDH7795517.1 EmrB/QacA subfamily drug resistance transporter [Beijerinckia sp. GAS462]SEC04866.1 drug resistance transporter, EmrB/QacA subfamily [Beijerinckia sp. 28-YEA-48]